MADNGTTTQTTQASANNRSATTRKRQTARRRSTSARTAARRRTQTQARQPETLTTQVAGVAESAVKQRVDRVQQMTLIQICPCRRS
jgi:hypothetical protein